MSTPPYNNYHNDFYERPTTAQSTVVGSPPPPLPHHIETGRDSTDQYAMKEIPVNSPNPYPIYSAAPQSTPPLPQHRFSNNSRESVSDMKFIDHYDSDDDLQKIIPRERKKRSCMDKLCCGCCTCCPKWLRWCSCIFLIIILILAIIVGVLAALFKMPQINFTGLDQAPAVTTANNVITLAYQLGITVNNPNFESITFESIKAEAWYPSPYNVEVGGGNLSNVHIYSNAVTNITFPFTVEFNATDSSEQGVLLDLITKCGFDGSTPQNIKFNYYVKPTVRIAGIAITPTISESMSIACPIKSGDLTSLFGSNSNL